MNITTLLIEEYVYTIEQAEKRLWEEDYTDKEKHYCKLIIKTEKEILNDLEKIHANEFTWGDFLQKYTTRMNKLQGQLCGFDFTDKYTDLSVELSVYITLTDAIKYAILGTLVESEMHNSLN